MKLRYNLFHAIDINFVEGVEAILSHDPCMDLSIKTYNYYFKVGMTPLLLAAHNNNYQILKLLYNYGHRMKVCQGVFFIKSYFSLYSLYYDEACDEFAGPSRSTSLGPRNTAPFKEMLQRWRAVGNTVSDLTGPKFEPQTSRSRDERVTAQLTARL